MRLRAHQGHGSSEAEQEEEEVASVALLSRFNIPWLIIFNMEECFLEVEVVITKHCRSSRPCCRTLTRAELSLLAKTRDKTAMVKHLMVETETKKSMGSRSGRERSETLCQESSLLVCAREPAKELLNDDEIALFFVV